VTTAIGHQNAQVPVGQIGATPSVEGQQLNVIMQAGQLCAPSLNLKNSAAHQSDGSRVC